MDLESIRLQWAADRPVYERFGKQIARELSVHVKRRGIYCTVTHRAKDTASLLKKVLRKSYQSPYDRIGDKVGVRVVVFYPDALETVIDVVGELFKVQGVDNKIDALGHDRLGYLGYHFEISLLPEAIEPETEEFRGKRCELQLHTAAQTLWANVSHQLTYKPAHPIPTAIQRPIFRLTSLMELFDGEVDRTRAALRALPDFREGAMLAELEQHFFRFTAKQYDRELSLEVIGGLLHLFTPEEVAGYGDLSSAFVARNEVKLDRIFSDYLEDDRHVLMSQPEALLVFERLEHDPFVLRERWEEVLPFVMLDSMAAIWGVPV